ncbi:DUF742 domain-containing protein [Actinomycetospora chiangmaiensis]|uniref:DUF742 domain-containing protein n=1 Tax=Actinomycetospora chiangmaiensis TaxID=402650 RepID=UPI001FE0D49B|nr:DUF742 domain-containing protein [Actinomycetospora chiangmaiensis]
MTEERGGEARHGRLRRRQTVGRTGARFPRTVEPPVEPAEQVLEAVEVPLIGTDPPSGPVVGRTGARFPRTVAQAAGGPDPAPPVEVATGSDPPSGTMVGRTGARFGSRARQIRRALEQQAAEDAVVPVQAVPLREKERYDPVHPCPDESPTAPLHLAELKNRAEGYESRVSVRPYVRTRGRTRARPDLRVETLISLPRPRPPLEDPEHVVIGDLCDAAPRSVAEVAALMRVPLGVARVLIGDMADDGSVRIHPTAAAGPQHGPDREMMARVLRGLHGL